MSKHDTWPGNPIENLSFGTIIEVDGTHIVAELDTDIAELSRVYGGVIYPIGQFGSIIRIHFGRRVLFAYVSRLRMKVEYDRERGMLPDSNPTARVIEADLFGEGEWLPASSDQSWKLTFDRGITTFPLPQQRVYLTPRKDLGEIFGQGSSCGILIGEHVGAAGTLAYADMDELLGKHTAILGSTGSGKSGTVASLIHAVLERGSEAKYGDWNPRVVILDPHNEYGAAFPDAVRMSTDEGTLQLPYWMLDFEETASLFVGHTEHAATSQTNIIRNALLEARKEGAVAIGMDAEEITVDSPVPYKMGNAVGLDEFGQSPDGEPRDGFVGAVNSLRPSGQDRRKHEDYTKVLRKLATLQNDSRLQFMMTSWEGESDDFSNIAGQLLGQGAPVRIIDLSGVPSEVAGAASSAIARLLFMVKVWQFPDERKSSPVLLVCEEAHRYVPNRGEAMYAAAQAAIQRIAKEGRKYGIGLLLVSQRPSEVDATVLSQCNSWIVLRTTNDADRDHVRAILPDSLAGLTRVLSGLRRREAIFVGQATLLPTRILIRELSQEQLPDSHDISFDEGWQNANLTDTQLTEIAQRWRLQVRGASTQRE